MQLLMESSSEGEVRTWDVDNTGRGKEGGDRMNTRGICRYSWEERTGLQGRCRGEAHTDIWLVPAVIPLRQWST